MDERQLTDDNWQTLEAAYAALTGDSDLRELVEHYGFNIVFTRETLAHYAEARQTSWRQPGVREPGEGFIVYRRVQAVRGEERRDMAVVDCGDFRVCIEHGHHAIADGSEEPLEPMPGPR